MPADPGGPAIPGPGHGDRTGVRPPPGFQLQDMVVRRESEQVELDTFLRQSGPARESLLAVIGTLVAE